MSRGGAGTATGMIVGILLILLIAILALFFFFGGVTSTVSLRSAKRSNRP